jgi:hypothetical protein
VKTFLNTIDELYLQGGMSKEKSEAQSKYLPDLSATSSFDLLTTRVKK